MQLTDWASSTLTTIPLVPYRLVGDNSPSFFYSCPSGDSGGMGDYWVSDGTQAGTRMLTKAENELSADDAFALVLNGAYYTNSNLFAADRFVSDGETLWEVSYDCPTWGLVGEVDDVLIFSSCLNYHHTLHAYDRTDQSLSDITPYSEDPNVAFHGYTICGMTDNGFVARLDYYNSDPNPYFFDVNTRQWSRLAEVNPGGDNMTNSEQKEYYGYLLSDIYLATLCEKSFPVSESGGYAVFTLCKSGFGYEPWISDGTPEGTLMFADIEPGTAGSYPFNFVWINGTVYFRAWQNGMNRIFSYDPEADLLNVVDDLFEGNPDMNTSYLFAAGDKLVYQRWVDGLATISTLDTTTGTLVRHESGQSLSFNTSPLFPNECDGYVFYTASVKQRPPLREMYVHDPQTGISTMLMDDLTLSINAFSGEVMDDSPIDVVKLACGRYVFCAKTTAYGFDFFSTDLTAEGTRPLFIFTYDEDDNPIFITEYFRRPRGLAVIGNNVYYPMADDTGFAQDLWVTDGIYGGSNLVSLPDEGSVEAISQGPDGDLIVAVKGTGGIVLYSFDGAGNWTPVVDQPAGLMQVKIPSLTGARQTVLWGFRDDDMSTLIPILVDSDNHCAFGVDLPPELCLHTDTGVYAIEGLDLVKYDIDTGVRRVMTTLEEIPQEMQAVADDGEGCIAVLRFGTYEQYRIIAANDGSATTLHYSGNSNLIVNALSPELILYSEQAHAAINDEFFFIFNKNTPVAVDLLNHSSDDPSQYYVLQKTEFLGNELLVHRFQGLEEYDQLCVLDPRTGKLHVLESTDRNFYSNHNMNLLVKSGDTLLYSSFQRPDGLTLRAVRASPRSWFGPAVDDYESSGWSFTFDHGWIYPIPEGDDLYFYSPVHGWVWTSQDFYEGGYLYRYTDSSWLFYFRNGDRAHNCYYNYSSGLYEQYSE